MITENLNLINCLPKKDIFIPEIFNTVSITNKKVTFNLDENHPAFFYLKDLKVALDIDEVLSDFLGGYKERYGEREINSWFFSYNTITNLEKLKHDKDFWLNLKPLMKGTDIPFLPYCYISKRNFPISWTEEWLEKNGFPCVNVYHVESDKTQICKETKIDYFVDDSIWNFQTLNKNGIKTFLYTGIHNKQYDVGDLRLDNLNDLPYKI